MKKASSSATLERKRPKNKPDKKQHEKKREKKKREEREEEEVEEKEEESGKWKVLDLTVRHGDRFVKVSQVANKPQEVARYGVKLPLELSRHWNVKTLRDALYKALEHAGLPVKHSLFDWWVFCTQSDTASALQASVKLADFDVVGEEDEEEKSKAQDRVVPNLESGLRHLRDAFDSELLRPVSQEQRDAIEKEFEPELRQRIKLMATAMRKSSHPSAPSEAEVTLADGEVVVGRVHMQIRPEYRKKLLKLYTLYGNPKGDGFDVALAALLLRYDPFGGGSYQCSLPALVFDVLKSEFGVFLECFASPLNAHFPRYCSAFEDTDFAFGSLGSFFAFRPTEGSFESHPPPVPDVVDQMVAHMDELCMMTKKPLSFVVVLSAQGADSALVDRVKASRFCRHHLTLKAHHHCFTVGKEHRHKENKLLQLCVKDSSVLWIQNDGGHDRWAPTEERLVKLTKAFGGRDPNEAPAATVPAAPVLPTPPLVAKSGSNWKQLQAKLKKTKQ